MDIIGNIRTCAEKVLSELARTDKVNILSIAEQLGERSTIVYQSIGWLACEGRIRYLQVGSQVYISLQGNGK
ncbi:MAG: winged helix-turn-helix domain-containing protein [Spirochaetia bacterium]|jgi:hypothetical protein